MSKKRKTRKEKIRSTERTQMSISQESSMPVYSFTSAPQAESVKSESRSFSKQASYSYVISDIRHTLIITSILFAGSFVLYFLFQNQIVRLTMFGY